MERGLVGNGGAGGADLWSWESDYLAAFEIVDSFTLDGPFQNEKLVLKSPSFATTGNLWHASHVEDISPLLESPWLNEPPKEENAYSFIDFSAPDKEMQIEDLLPDGSSLFEFLSFRSDVGPNAICFPEYQTDWPAAFSDESVATEFRELLATCTDSADFSCSVKTDTILPVNPSGALQQITAHQLEHSDSPDWSTPSNSPPPVHHHVRRTKKSPKVITVRIPKAARGTMKVTEKKRKQNKTAAKRYRTKKRNEVDESREKYSLLLARKEDLLSTKTDLEKNLSYAVHLMEVRVRRMAG